MAYVSGLRCRECSREYPAEALNVCDFCFGPLEVDYDYDTISQVISKDKISRGPLSIGVTKTYSQLAERLRSILWLDTHRYLRLTTLEKGLA